MLVLGDSVTWGQGLLEHEKMHAIVREAISARRGAVRSLLLAHSGAIIGAGSEGSAPPADGEVPTSFPTILQQCDAAPETDVDLVLLNGGINDIDARFLLSPLTAPADLRDVTRAYCYRDMLILLARVLARFPRAFVVCASYYPVLSAASHFPLMQDFLLAAGVPVAPLVRFGDVELIFGNVLRNCRQFYEESTRALRQAIDEVNQAAGRRRAALAAPPFADVNAALASEAWLFGIRADLSPEDPIAAGRRESCTRYEPDWLQREQCFRASAGHPNPIGARKFAEAILDVVE